MYKGLFFTFVLIANLCACAYLTDRGESKPSTPKAVRSEVATRNVTTDKYVPHPEWREEVYPHNVDTRGPVTFLWPVPAKTKANEQPDLSYDFVLSQHIDLSTPLLKKSRQPWAFVNTHSALKKGHYYWQITEYRDGKPHKTSQIYQFNQVDEQGGFVTSDSDDFVNAVLHSKAPRLMATPATLAKITSRIQSLYPQQYQSILNNSKAYIDVTLPDIQYGGQFYKDGKRVLINKKFPDGHPKSKPTGRIYYNAVKAFSKAWLVTGEEKYAQEGIRWAKNLLKFDPTKGVMTPHGALGFPQDDFDYAVLMPTLAIAFDTFYGQMDLTTRRDMAEHLRQRTAMFYQYFRNRLEARVIDNHAWQHTYFYFLEAAIALAGYFPEAKDYLAYAYGVWVARFPLQSIEDGGWTNGKYVSVNIGTWLETPIFIRRYTDTNFYQHPFFANQVDWMINRFPPQSAADGFGGDGYEVEKKVSKQTLDYLLVLNQELNLPKIGWYVKAWGSQQTEPQLHWSRFIEQLTQGKTDTKSSPAFNPKQYAKTHLFADVGIVNMQSNWTNIKTNLSVNLRSAPWGNFGHNLPNSNSVNILYGGEPLFYPNGYRHGGGKHAYEWYRHTRSFNSVLVNGKGQPVSSDAWGQITQLLDSGNITYVQADASNAYHARPSAQWLDRFSHQGVDWYQQMDEPLLNTFKRNLVYVRDGSSAGVVIIYDELAADKAVDWDWLMHSVEHMQITDYGLVSENKRGRGHLHLFSSHELQTKLTNKALHKPINVDGRKEKGVTSIYLDKGWHFSAQIKQQQSSRFLAVIDINRKDAKALPVTQNANGDIVIGNLVIAAELDPTRPVKLAVTLADGRVLQADGQTASLGEQVSQKITLHRTL